MRSRWCRVLEISFSHWMLHSYASYHLQLLPICVLWKHLQAPKSFTDLSIANMLENPAQDSCV